MGLVFKNSRILDSKIAALAGLGRKVGIESFWEFMWWREGEYIVRNHFMPVFTYCSGEHTNIYIKIEFIQ